MRVLATAKPNRLYRWWHNLEYTTIQARLTNETIHYYELDSFSLKGKMLTEEFVKELFPIGIPIANRPFLAKDNINFYTVLHRNRVRYKDAYLKLKGKPAMFRTKYNKPTRTK
jgi:hypothetical protein